MKTEGSKIIGVIILLVAVLIGVFLVLGKRSYQRKVEEKETVVPTPTLGYQKGIPQKAEKPSPKAGEIEIINEPGVVKKIEIDTSNAFRKAFYQLYKDTLKDFGYSLTIYNKKEVTDEFTVPGSAGPSGGNSSGCMKYGYRWDSSKGTIEVFFNIHNPTAPCEADRFRAIINTAIGRAHGEVYEWWTNGKAKIAKELGKEPGIEDYSIFVAR